MFTSQVINLVAIPDGSQSQFEPTSGLGKEEIFKIGSQGLPP